jgi:hypothetical protein
MPTPTYVPTYVPVAGSSFAVTPTPYAIPTSSFDGTNSPTPAPGSGTNPFEDKGFLALTAVLVCVCCLMLLVIGVFILGFVVRRNNAKAKGTDNA